MFLAKILEIEVISNILKNLNVAIFSSKIRKELVELYNNS